MRRLACFLKLFGFLHIASRALANVEIWVDCNAPSSGGSGTSFNPWQALDDAIGQAQGDSSGDPITILLNRPGEYPLNHASYDLSTLYDLSIFGTADSWDGDKGPKLVRGSGVSTTLIQFNVTFFFAITNVALGLPETDAPLSGFGTQFCFYFTNDAIFTGSLTLENVTFKGGLNPNFETNQDVLSITVAIDADENNLLPGLGNMVTHTNCKVRPGVIYSPSVPLNYIAISGLDFQGPSVLRAWNQQAFTFDFTDSVIRKP
ncbi:hypothetical protein HDU86_008313 [Geranomyces michiganensis]|nr:hypothetical protein HDU86_008313 [Geranomyces michiganensis]